MKKKYYTLLIILAAILWSVDGLLRRSLRGIPPATIVMIEHILRVLIVLPWLSRFIPEYKKLKKRDWSIVIALGVISGALATTLYTAALAQVQDISYSVVALLQQTQPIFTVLLAILILKERLTLRYLLFATLALTSSYFLTFPQYTPTFLGHRGEVIAAALALGASFCWGIGTILSKLLLNKLSYAATAILRFIIVVPVAFLFSLFSSPANFSLASITSTQWFYLFAIALFSGVVSFVIYYKGLQHTEAKVSTLAEFAWPLSAAILGFIFLGERLTTVQIVAGIILLVDILALSLLPQKSPSS